MSLKQNDVVINWLTLLRSSTKTVKRKTTPLTNNIQDNASFSTICGCPVAFHFDTSRMNFKTIHNNYMVAMWLKFPFRDISSDQGFKTTHNKIIWLQCGLSLRDVSSDQAFKTIIIIWF